MDQLRIHGLELWLRVGCTEEERAFPQRIELDVALELDLRKAGRTDDIAKSIDYAAVADALKKELTPKTFRLAEAVAEQAADQILWRFKPAAVVVRLKKRALPGIDWAGVEIRRP